MTVTVVKRDVPEPDSPTLVASVVVISKDEGVVDPLERAELVALPAQVTGTPATEVLVLFRSAICVCEAVPPEVADPGGLVDKKLVVASVRTEDIVCTRVLPDMVRVTRVVVVCGTSKTQPTSPSCSNGSKSTFPSPLDILRWLQVLRPSPAHCLKCVSQSTHPGARQAAGMLRHKPEDKRIPTWHRFWNRESCQLKTRAMSVAKSPGERKESRVSKC